MERGQSGEKKFCFLSWVTGRMNDEWMTEWLNDYFIFSYSACVHEIKDHMCLGQ